MAYFRLNREEKRISTEIVEKLEHLRSVSGSDAAILSMQSFRRMLTSAELDVAEKFLDIKPSVYGSAESFIGFTTALKKDLVVISGQRYVSRFDGKEKKIRTQYLPKRVFGSYKRMHTAMRKDIGSGVLVLSGYRTPWYQLLLLVHKYINSDFRVSRAIQWVALPGWSQHGDSVHTAIDFMTERGEYFGKHFASTQEYMWLKKNAREFGFMESFPRNNKLGVSYEPWHWRYAAKK